MLDTFSFIEFYLVLYARHLGGFHCYVVRGEHRIYYSFQVIGVLMTILLEGSLRNVWGRWHELEMYVGANSRSFYL